MRGLKKIFLVLSLFVLSEMNAQNLVPNGGFEEVRTHLGQTKFEGWTFHRSLSLEKTQGYKGSNAAKVYMNNLSFSILNKGKFNVLKIQKGAYYKLSYWVKGEQGTEKIEPILTWYDADGDKLSGGRQYLKQTTASNDWSEKLIKVTAPAIAASAGLSFRVSSSGNSISIDEVSFVKTGVSTTIPAPTGFEKVGYQREVAFYWHKGLPNTKWEVVFNGNSKIVETNSYIATGLEPNRSYSIKLRTLVGSDKSAFIEDKVSTKSFNKQKDDPMRIPHLRTLGISGDSNRIINLFYTDLYNEKADISYEVDGKVMIPIDNKLTFPKEGKQVMKTVIKEDNIHQWEMIYNLNVK